MRIKLRKHSNKKEVGCHDIQPWCWWDQRRGVSIQMFLSALKLSSGAFIPRGPLYLSSFRVFSHFASIFQKLSWYKLFGKICSHSICEHHRDRSMHWGGFKKRLVLHCYNNVLQQCTRSPPHTFLFPQKECISPFCCRVIKWNVQHRLLPLTTLQPKGLEAWCVF